mgnify:CR=1 FL=1
MRKKLSTKWDLTPLFKNDDPKALKRELLMVKKISYQFINKWRNKTDYLTKPKVAAKALADYRKWATHTGLDGKAGYYLALRLAQEETNPKLKALEGQVRDSTRIDSTVAKARPR